MRDESKRHVPDDSTDYDEFPVEQTDNSVRPEDGDQSGVTQEPVPEPAWEVPDAPHQA